MKKLKSSMGRWVIGDEFFNRRNELKLLMTRVTEGNHVLLEGQRRMGKTSLAKELGRQLEMQGWLSIYIDIEDAKTPQDVISEIAGEVVPLKGVLKRFRHGIKNRLKTIDELSIGEAKIKFRAEINEADWKDHGNDLMHDLASFEQPIYLIIDELPIFLSRLIQSPTGQSRVEVFLSWLRKQLQDHNDGSLVILLAGSIGLQPMLKRLGMTEKINHLEPAFHLGPWNKKTCRDCLLALAENYGIKFDADAIHAVYKQLGLGIPHHVQSFFTRLREDAILQGNSQITKKDVKRVYQSGMLGPRGLTDLAHYESRLQNTMDDISFQLANAILAEAAIGGVFGATARNQLIQTYIKLYKELDGSVEDTIDNIMSILEHDGYIEKKKKGYVFSSKLLRDWWAARFENHHEPLA